MPQEFKEGTPSDRRKDCDQEMRNHWGFFLLWSLQLSVFCFLLCYFLVLWPVWQNTASTAPVLTFTGLVPTMSKFLEEGELLNQLREARAPFQSPGGWETVPCSAERSPRTPATGNKGVYPKVGPPSWLSLMGSVSSRVRGHQLLVLFERLGNWDRSLSPNGLCGLRLGVMWGLTLLECRPSADELARTHIDTHTRICAECFGAHIRRLVSKSEAAGREPKLARSSFPGRRIPPGACLDSMREGSGTCGLPACPCHRCAPNRAPRKSRTCRTGSSSGDLQCIENRVCRKACSRQEVTPRFPVFHFLWFPLFFVSFSSFRPTLRRNCSSGACDVCWRTGPWRPCTVACGRGFQSRKVDCVRVRSCRPVAETHCVQRRKPASWRHCLGPSCESTYPAQVPPPAGCLVPGVPTVLVASWDVGR